MDDSGTRSELHPLSHSGINVSPAFHDVYKRGVTEIHAKLHVLYYPAENPTQDYLGHYVYRVVGIIVFVIIVTGICVTPKKVCKGETFVDCYTQ